MQKVIPALAILASSVTASSCTRGQDDAKRSTARALTATVSPVAAITFIGADTLGDSARIYQVEPEPDGGSVAFLFADPAKGITRGLGIVQTSENQPAQIGWPDSVLAVWWSSPHQLSFTAGTGQGVRLVVDAHAAQLEAVEVTGERSARPTTIPTPAAKPTADALSRAQAFIDSVRIQPEGTPQGSSLRYQPDTILVAPGDTLAAVYVSAGDPRGAKVNPAWYLVHLPSGHVHAVDSLTGRAPGFTASAGRWGPDGSFYYAKERSIWRARPSVQ